MAEAQILVVEDEGIVAKDIQNMLKILGYAVAGLASSGEEAIEKVEVAHPDLVPMDIGLKGDMDGIEAAKQIRARYNIPLIYLTAYSDKNTLQRAKITEPFGYILKPFEARELHTTIEMAFYRHKLGMKLKESERWLATTLKSIGDAVIATDKEGLVRFMNPVAEALTGWKQEEAVGKDLGEVFNIIHEETYNLTETPVTEAIQESADVALANHILIAKDGAETPIDDIAAPIRDDKGNIMGAVLVFRDITERKRAELELKNAFSEIERLKDHLEREKLYLQEEINLQYSYGEIVGQTKAINAVLSQVEQVAYTDSAVLLLGETGTGKELLARAIHNLSPRKGRAMVKVSCAALPSTLIESELFGHEKGAFTGAFSKQIGRFEVADGGTIFLDDVSELPLELQVKLLRVLQEKRFERLGSPNTVVVDVRVIASTNRDLSKAVRDGLFREDLYYRLNVFPIHVPPLRERRDDIPLLAQAFVKEFGERMGKRIEKIPKITMKTLQRYQWPGNVRELRNVIERAMILTQGSTLRLKLPSIQDRTRDRKITLEEIERSHMLDVLEMTGWRIRGKGCAAEILGIKPTTLESRMLKLDIKRNS